MLKPKEQCGLLYMITSEIHLKYMCLNTNNVNVNENMVPGLFYNASSTAVLT
jgi:hypothetical protein